VRLHGFRELCRFDVEAVVMHLNYSDARHLFLHSEKAVGIRRGLSMVIHSLVGIVVYDHHETKIVVKSRYGTRITPLKYMRGTISRYSRIEIYTPPDQALNIMHGLFFEVITVAIRFNEEDTKQLFLSLEEAVKRCKGVCITLHGLVGSVDYDGVEVKLTVRSRRGARVMHVKYRRGTASSHSYIEIYAPPDQAPAIIQALKEVLKRWT